MHDAMPSSTSPIRRAFSRSPSALLPWLIGATALAFAVGLYLAAGAPDDYQQGATVKIMFIHVPSAWLAMGIWTLMSIAALGTLVWRHPLADVAAKAAAPIGAAFTLLCLVTGMLWGRPMWGAYWVWDARLTSVLVLFLMYLGVIALWRTVDDPSRAGRAAAILTLVGAINLPIIKFSVDWWNTLHQPASVLRLGGPGDPSDHPHAAAGDGARRSLLLFVTLHLAAMRNEILRRRVRTLMLMQAQAAPGSGGMNLGPHAGFILTAYGVGGSHPCCAGRLDRARPSRAAARARRTGSARRDAALRPQ